MCFTYVRARARGVRAAANWHLLPAHTESYLPPPRELAAPRPCPVSAMPRPGPALQLWVLLLGAWSGDAVCCRGVRELGLMSLLLAMLRAFPLEQSWS